MNKFYIFEFFGYNNDDNKEKLIFDVEDINKGFNTSFNSFGSFIYFCNIAILIC